jgi:Polyketide cyclase / dehydrase and lipid transport
MIIKIIIAVIVIIAGVLIYASTKPDIFHVERSINIKAAPEKIFPLINDFHAWEGWTPYNKDPAMKKTYSGSDSGKGAQFAWDGNKEAGKGEITITDTTPPNKLVFDLHMIKPFEGRNVATISLDAKADSTKVVWSLDDKHNLMLKTLSLFINLDKVIGKDFEVGLGRLKTIAEK